MITHHKIDGFDNFLKLMEVLDFKGITLVYFSGSPNPAGESWCMDCNRKLINTFSKAEKVLMYFQGSIASNGLSWCPFCRLSGPIIESVLNQNEHKTFHFVYVGVGTRDEWKKQSNPFRTDPKMKIKAVPTLLLWRTPKRLTGSECQSVDNVQMIIDEIQ